MRCDFADLHDKNPVANLLDLGSQEATRSVDRSPGSPVVGLGHEVKIAMRSSLTLTKRILS
jgi:hypothetical protein